MNYIEQYNELLQSGKIAGCKRLKRVYAQLVDDIKNPKDNYIFNERKAERPIEFIERFCKHSKGEWAGKPLILELFQKAFISALFGFIDKDTGLRKYKEAFFYVSRKNGKSTLLAGIALYCLIADKEAGAEVYSIASKKDQAKIIYDEICNMIKQSPQLLQVCKKRKSDIYFSLTFSKCQPLGRNSDSLDGLNSHLVIIDEVHSIKDRNTYAVMKQSQSARQQPLLIAITTAGFIRESIFDDLYNYAGKIADGIIKDNSYLPIFYELDNKDEWQDPKAWEKANPALNKAKKLEDIINKVERAKNSPKDLIDILCKDFNIISNVSSAWLTFDDVNNEETFNIKDFKGSYFIGGADLSITTDLTCATALLMDKNEKIYIKQMYFLPSDNFNERVQKDKIPYNAWKEAGLLRLCNGNRINYSDVTKWFLEIIKEYEITPAWIGYDPYSAGYWVQEMESNGFNMIKVIQGAKTLSLPLQTLGQDLKAKKINYDNNPMLKWCLSNVGVIQDRNGNILPVKNQSAKYRIDGAMSLLDAYTVLFNNYNEFLNAIK